MLDAIINTVTSWTLSTISSLGYFGVFLTMAIESASIPLPSEIIMPFSGFLVSLGKLNFYLVVLSGAAGNLFGSIVMYLVGLWGQETFVRRFVRGWGRFLLSEEELDLGEKWLRRYGEPVVLISRVLPVVRTFISLPAGMARVDFKRFCFLTFFGSIFWSAFLAYLGVKLGENWESLAPTFRQFDSLIVLAGIIVVGLYFYLKYRKVFYAKKNPDR